MKQSNVYSEKSKIVCSVCGKDLLENPDLSMDNIIQNTNNQKSSHTDANSYNQSGTAHDGADL